MIYFDFCTANYFFGGVATQKKPKKTEKTSPKFEIYGSVRFFSVFSVFFGFFGIFRFFFGFLWYFFGFFRFFSV